MEQREDSSAVSSVASTIFVLSLLLTACGPPTQGPIVRIDDDGWTADPVSMEQEREWFEVTLINSSQTEARFVIVRMEFGEVLDLPQVNGVVDVSRSQGFVTGPVEYDTFEPVVGPLVVSYYLVYPDTLGVTDATVPVLQSGEERNVRVGNRGLGGGEPGSYAVISYEPGSLERGDYVAFDLTDVDGEVPRFSSVEFCIPDPFQPLRVGDQIPQWQGLLLDGENFDSDTLAGDPALILVFPAQRTDDIAVLEVFNEVAKEREGEIGAVMVNIGASGNEGTVAGFLDGAGVTAPVVVDDVCHLQAIFRIGWEEPPYWIMTDGDGVITGLEYGPKSVDQVQSMVISTQPSS
jgi:hypothetical protein